IIETSQEARNLMTGKVQRIERQQSRGFLKNAILLIPNFLKLLFRLFRDPRVPLAEKALLVGAIVYVISPLDLIPDFIPFIGEVDDLYFVALTLLRLFARTPDAVIREHWDGGGDIAGVANKIVRAAQYILPKRIRRIILGRVEIGSGISGDEINPPLSFDPISTRPRMIRRMRLGRMYCAALTILFATPAMSPPPSQCSRMTASGVRANRRSSVRATKYRSSTSPMKGMKSGIRSSGEMT